MPLLDVAQKLNKRHDALIKEEAERIRQSELRLRRLQYYKQFSQGWFEDLSVAVGRLIDEFNAATGEHSKLKRLFQEMPVEDSITFQFIRSTHEPESRPPTGLLRKDPSDLRITFEVEHQGPPLIDQFEVVVKAFSSLRVRVDSVTERQSLGEGVQWNDRKTGETQYAPTFVTEKIRKSQEFDVNEFADYILSKFAEKML